ncbi:Gem-associated-like protein [Hirschfeldia incana]|nr:Gem-associated-like protein [Hirschfeldia incana]
MMMVQEEFQERKNLSVNDIDLSLLRLSSPPTYDSFFFTPVSPPDSIISPLKRSSPVSDESDHPKRRRLSPSQDPIFISSPLRSTYPEPHSSTIDDPTTQYPVLTVGHPSPVSEKQETSPYASKTPDTETMKMVNNHVEEINQEETTNYDAFEELYRQETNYDAYEEEEKEEDCGEGMRIERSGDGFVIRLKCRCKLAFRVLFSDHHLYFKSL